MSHKHRVTSYRIKAMKVVAQCSGNSKNKKIIFWYLNNIVIISNVLYYALTFDAENKIHIVIALKTPESRESSFQKISQSCEIAKLEAFKALIENAKQKEARVAGKKVLFILSFKS